MARAARRSGWSALGAGLTLALAASCGPPRQEGFDFRRGGLPPLADGAMGRIELRHIASKPRLTLVSRDGDPSPALVMAVATDLGSAASTALAAVIEARMRAAGLAVDTRADRNALRVRWTAADARKLPAFFDALSAALRRPIEAGTAEVAYAAERMGALRRHPLEAAELAPIAACTGRLGVPASEALPDLTTPAGVRELEAWRRGGLGAGRTSIAAVGPAPFCLAVAQALERASGWEAGLLAADPWPPESPVGAYIGAGIADGSGRVTLAVRVAGPYAAVAAAERLGAADSPMAARLLSLSEPWRAVEVTGAARPHGGCVSVTIEPTRRVDRERLGASAAIAAALVQREIRTELGGVADPNVAARQVLTAADPVEAASRAAWWALAGPAPHAGERAAIALGAPPPAGVGGTAVSIDATRADFQRGLERAAATSWALERRARVERGQGELWLLLASPCGVAEEGRLDAGATALGALSAVRGRREDDVTIEPWISAEGIGVIAHGGPRSASEGPADLARRVADAAGRTLAATPLTVETLGSVRTTALDHLERSRGSRAAAMETFAGAIAPEHPSWIDPFGTWSRIAANGVEPVEARWRALLRGPLRIAVLANADAAQAAAAASAADRWFAPRAGAPSPCAEAAPLATQPGRLSVRLPREEVLAQALIGAVVPPIGAPGRDLAELSGLALDGDDGLLSQALRSAQVSARVSARIVGGARSAALVADVRAEPGSLDAAVAAVKGLLARLGQGGTTEAMLARASARSAEREREQRADPRMRLAELWRGPTPTPPRATLATWTAWMRGALAEDKLVVVEARPE